jgi:hypothetical protein
MEPRRVAIMEKTPVLPNSNSRLRPPRILNHKMRINIVNCSNPSFQIITRQRHDRISFCRLVSFVRNSSSTTVAVSDINLPAPDAPSSLMPHSFACHQRDIRSHKPKLSFNFWNTPSVMDSSTESPSRLPRLASVPNPSTPQSVPRHRPTVS